MNLDVIIPVWITDDETLQITVDAVESIKKGCPDCKLILIDNGSTVGGGKLRELGDVYVRNKENLGYAPAVNQGLKLAGSIVAVANNDIRVSDNWWKISKKLFEYLDIGSVHFRMIPYDQAFNPGNQTWHKGKERWCSSSFFVMRNVQLYDEFYKNGYDDYDFWLRFRKLGLTTAYTNKVEYQHLDSFTQKKLTDRAERDKRNYEYFKEKHGEYPDILFAKMYPEQMSEPWRPFP